MQSPLDRKHLRRACTSSGNWNWSPHAGRRLPFSGHSRGSHMAAGKDARRAEASRTTKETAITVTVDLDGAGRSDIATGVGFFDHMLEQLSRHSLIDMTVKAKGDLHIDDHHTVEDTGIVLGQAIARALGERRGIARYASIDLAMDETLTKAAVDVSGRPYLVWNVEFSSPRIGTFD